MKPALPSFTAGGVTALRAVHQVLDDKPLVLDDPWAEKFSGLNLSDNERLSGLLRDPLFRNLVPWPWQRRGSAMEKMRAQVVVRSRLAEDYLEKAVSQGMSQLVILGAGYDSFAYRQPEWADSLRIFEVDHPKTQAQKKERIASLGIEMPDNLEFVPLDFEATTLEDGLTKSGFDAEKPAFFTWLGVSYYLTSGALTSTLAYLAEQAKGSQLVLDFWTDNNLRRFSDRFLLNGLKMSVAMQGEPLRSLLSPSEAEHLVAGSGMVVKELLNADDLNERYLESRTDGLEIPEFSWLCVAQNY